MRLSTPKRTGYDVRFLRSKRTWSWSRSNCGAARERSSPRPNACFSRVARSNKPLLEELNGVIGREQPAIEAILRDYNVPTVRDGKAASP